MVENATTFCKFEPYDIVVPPKVNTKLAVLFLLSISPAKSASTNPSNFKSLKAKYKQVS